jgi:TATA-binding protein-associated factor
MESLHKQVLPFILRRLKEHVLHDLPPKIIQDYYCELSPLQVRLYESVGQTVSKATLNSSKGQNMFQALMYLRKTCIHPLLVFNAGHPLYKGNVTIN